jgi:aspartyl/asparaginyl-tRNA synthetase
VAEFYGTKELTSEHELKMDSDFGHALLLTHFPQYTSPFWNMKKEGETSNKIDVILHGMETI